MKDWNGLKKEFETEFCANVILEHLEGFDKTYASPYRIWQWILNNFCPVEPEVMQKPKPKTLQAIFEIVDNIDFELAQLEDIAKGEIGDKITLLRKYINENRVSA